MNRHSAARTINGTFGEAWVDDYYVAEVTGVEAKITVQKAEVKQAMKTSKSYKVTGTDGKGTMKINKVTSYFSTKCLEEIKEGKTPNITIISKLADPDAYGAERVRLTGVIFDELPVVNWEVDKVGEESIGFTFEEAEFLDEIQVN